MSSNIEITKVCELCGIQFIARKTTTKCCSHRCSSMAYKARKRDKQIGYAKKKTEREILDFKLAEVQVKPMLTITETALLIGVSRPTIYAYLKNKELKALRLGSKTFIRLNEIYKKFDTISIDSFKPIPTKPPILDLYTIDQIKEKYPVKDSWIYKIIKAEKIPKTMHRGKTYYSAKHIDRYFSKQKKFPEISEWYTAEEIAKKFGMTPGAIHSFVYENAIPRKKVSRNAFYSKLHFDVAKGISAPPVPSYYTVQEAMEKFNLTRDSLYHIIRHNSITKIKVGRHIKISRRELDKIFELPIIY